jgi:hypothetical protein
VLAISFHPELAGETRFHRLLVTMATEYADPAEGSAAGGTEDRSVGEAM